jgi:hypothetical protein
MTTAAAARALGCSPVTVRHWCRRLGWLRAGRDYWLTGEQLEVLRGLVQPGPGRPRRVQTA